MATEARIKLKGDITAEDIPALREQFRLLKDVTRPIIDCTELSRVCPEFYPFLLGVVRVITPAIAPVIIDIPAPIYEALGRLRAHRLFEIDTSHLNPSLVEQFEQDTSPQLSPEGIKFICCSKGRGFCRITIKLTGDEVTSGTLAFALMPADSLLPPEEIYSRITIVKSSLTAFTEDARQFLHELGRKMGNKLDYGTHPEPIPISRDAIRLSPAAPNNDPPKPTTMTKREAGRRGGEVTAQRYGPQFYEEIGRKGGQKTKKLIEDGKKVEATES